MEFSHYAALDSHAQEQLLLELRGYWEFYDRACNSNNDRPYCIRNGPSISIIDAFWAFMCISSTCLFKCRPQEMTLHTVLCNADIEPSYLWAMCTCKSWARVGLSITWGHALVEADDRWLLITVVGVGWTDGHLLMLMPKSTTPRNQWVPPANKQKRKKNNPNTFFDIVRNWGIHMCRRKPRWRKQRKWKWRGIRSSLRMGSTHLILSIQAAFLSRYLAYSKYIYGNFMCVLGILTCIRPPQNALKCERRCIIYV